MRTPSFLVLAALIFATGCGEDDAIVGQAVFNTPPDTHITGTPPSPLQSKFEVTFFWNGEDPDGIVVGYEWRISNNGSDGIVDVTDTLTVDLPWNFTLQADSTFVVSAEIDSFAVDVDKPWLDPGEYRFWQTHTIWIRAVDEDGARDPSPAHLSFTATTLAPQVVITLPPRRAHITCRQAPRVATFGWLAFDPDADPSFPAETRHLFMPVRLGPDDQCYTQLDYERAMPIRADDSRWSEWRPYDVQNDSTRQVTLPRQEFGTRWLFAVQARDFAGAVTPTFEWGWNVSHIEVLPGAFPILRVRESMLGEAQSVSTNGVRVFEVVSGQPLQFQWSGDASHYAGFVDAYRYGWDVRDPDDPDDPGWEIAWSDGPLARNSDTRTFESGSPTFVVQCRDNSGTISRLVYQFQIIQITDRSEQRPLLLIDDWPIGGSAPERDFKLQWKRRWDGILRERVVGFQPWEIIDAQSEAARVSFRLLNEYSAVIWFLGPSVSSYFYSRVAPQELEGRFNWVEAYQARAGNILLCGPSATYGTFDRDPNNIAWIFPIVFNNPSNFGLGFGQALRPDGSVFNQGTTRWPYSGWCIEAMDQVRPTFGQVFGELPGTRLREGQCDALARAEVVDRFLNEYPDATSRVRDLLPRRERIDNDPEYKFPVEEFYNQNVTSRGVSLDLRPCQKPMYVLRALRDEGYIDNPVINCRPTQLQRSPIDGVTIGLASTVHSDTKQLRGAEDFLWGFHPVAFESREVADALSWIFESRWQIQVLR